MTDDIITGRVLRHNSRFITRIAQLEADLAVAVEALEIGRAYLRAIAAERETDNHIIAGALPAMAAQALLDMDDPKAARAAVAEALARIKPTVDQEVK